MPSHRLIASALCAVTLGSFAHAQSLASPLGSGRATCNPWRPVLLTDRLSFAERSCFALSQLVNPGLMAATAFQAGFSQWRNSPHMNKSDSDDVSVRFEHLYERRTARVTAEMLVGYWHHEDPRPRISGATGTWRRTGAALMSVLTSPDENGQARMALAPLAGSLASGFTTMPLYQRQNSVGWALERSGLVYSRYFARALYHEFSPEIWSLAPKFVRKYHKSSVLDP